MVVCGKSCCCGGGCVRGTGGSGNLEGGDCGPTGAEAHRWSTGLGGDVVTEVLLDAADCVVSGAGGFGGGLPPEGGVVL